jgi:hypothetical protein
MEIRTVGSPGRPIQREVNRTNEVMNDATNDERGTNHETTTRRKKTRHELRDDNDESTTKGQQQNPHPAWNPDSRWSR